MRRQFFVPRNASFAAAAWLATVTHAACSSQAPSPGASTQPAVAPTAAATRAAVVTLLEPPDGQFAGHIADFRWSPVDGADGYRMRIATLSGRVVWESPVLTSAEAHLPATVALEPEGHTWQVTALKGADVLATSAVFRFTITP